MRALLRRIVATAVILPLAVILIALALANRQMVTLSLDPFNSETPALAFSTPLFVALFIALMAGVLIGGTASWIGQRKHRREKRMHRKEAEKLRAEAEKLRAGQAPGSALAATSAERFN